MKKILGLKEKYFGPFFSFASEFIFRLYYFIYFCQKFIEKEVFLIKKREKKKFPCSKVCRFEKLNK